MTINITLPDVDQNLHPKITVLGVGGSGGLRVLSLAVPGERGADVFDQLLLLRRAALPAADVGALRTECARLHGAGCRVFGLRSQCQQWRLVCA